MKLGFLTIHQLPSAGPLTGAEEVPLQYGPDTKKTTTQDIANLVVVTVGPPGPPGGPGPPGPPGPPGIDRFLGESWVPTAESTNSAVFTDLATPDAVTFTAPASGMVWAEWDAQVSDLFGAGVVDELNVDGVLDATTEVRLDPSAYGVNFTMIRMRILVSGLAAGLHTISVQHREQTGATMATWRNRGLVVWDAT